MEIVFKRWQCCIRRQSLDTYPYISTHIENITLKHTFWKMWRCRFRLFKSTEQLGSARTAHRKQRPSAQSFLRNEPPRFKRSARSEGGEMSDAAGSQSNKRGPAGCSVRPAALGQRSEPRSRSGKAAPGRGHRRRARPQGRGRRGGGEREGGRAAGPGAAHSPALSTLRAVKAAFWSARSCGAAREQWYLMKGKQPVRRMW